MTILLVRPADAGSSGVHPLRIAACLLTPSGAPALVFDTLRELPQ